MAESILKLRVDSSEYDSKIDRARQGLLHLGDSLNKAGKSFKDADADQVKFAAALGNMPTKTNTARGAVAELTKAYTDLRVQYDKLSDADKKSDFGKGLAASLETMKTRIIDGKKELEGIGRELGDTGAKSSGLESALNQLTAKFGMSAKTLAGWGTAIAAVKGALDVAKDAFFANESAVDEWGRVVDSSKSLYEGFLTALNTGDISGYLSRIDEIVQAARTAYNELDALGSMRTIQAPKMSAQQTENERLRMMVQTGRYIAPVDGRAPTPGLKNGQLLTPAQIKTIEQQIQNGLKTMTTLVGNEVKQSGRAIDAVYERFGAELGMSVEEFRKGTSSWSEFQRRIEGASAYSQWQRENSFVDQSSGRLVAPTTGNPYSQFAGWDVFRVDGERYNELVQLIRSREQQMGQMYGMQSQAYRAINRAEGISTRKLLGGGSGGSGAATKLQEGGIKAAKGFDELAGETFATYESMASLRKKLAAYQNALDNATNGGQEIAAIAGINSTKWQMSDTGRQAAKLGWTQQDLEDAAKALRDGIQKAMDKAGPIKIEVTSDGAKRATADAIVLSKEWNNAAQAVSQVGSAMSSIENPAAKVMGTIAQAIATIALSYAQASQKAAQENGPWAWIAFAATGLATMVSSISAIKAATASKYAEGGIIKGNSYSGDNILMPVDSGGVASLNAGEVVLNKAAQGNLASQLTNGNNIGSLHSTRVSGEHIYIALNNYLRSSGRGELITWDNS